MSVSATPEKLSMWQAGFDLFGKQWKEWLRWAAVFFAVTAVIQILTFDPETQKIFQQMNADTAAGKKPSKEDLDHMMDAILHMGVKFIVPYIIISIVQSYAFTVFFMKKITPVIDKPELSIGRFFWWFWNGFLVFLIVGAAELVFFLPLMLSIMFFKSHPLFLPIAIFISVIGFVLTLFLVMRLALVTTFAVTTTNSVFKAAWHLTKDNCWRIFGNGFLFMLIVGLLSLLLAFVEKSVIELLFSLMPGTFSSPDVHPPHAMIVRLFTPAMQAPYGPVGQYLDIVFQAVNLCLFSGLIRAFYAAVAQILYQESQASPAASPA